MKKTSLNNQSVGFSKSRKSIQSKKVIRIASMIVGTIFIFSLAPTFSRGYSSDFYLQIPVGLSETTGNANRQSSYVSGLVEAAGVPQSAVQANPGVTSETALANGSVVTTLPKDSNPTIESDLVLPDSVQTIAEESVGISQQGNESGLAIVDGLEADNALNGVNHVDEANISDLKVPNAFALETNPDIIQKALEDNTIRVESKLSEQGIPVELLEPDNFQSDGGKVYVHSTSINVRSGPDETSEIVDQLEYADEIVRASKGSAWSQVELSDGTVGYVVSNFLTTEKLVKPTPTPTPSPTATPTPKPTIEVKPTKSPVSNNQGETITETSISGTYYAVGVLNVRSGPGTGFDVTKTLSKGDGIDVVAKTSNGWYKSVKGTYVIAELTTASKPVVNTPTAPEAPKVNPAPPAPAPDTSSDFASYCRSFLGIPYVFASASTSGFDCSGFVSYVYRNYYNISLPHQSHEISKLGTAIDADNIAVGDVICYDYSPDGVIDHVGLYIGDGKVVHASSSRARVVETSFSTSSVYTIRRFS